MTNLFEAEIIQGLAEIAINEIREAIAPFGEILSQPRPNEITFTYSGDIKHLQNLYSIIAIYCVVRLPVPRPKALLGHQYFTQIINQSQEIIAQFPQNSFQSLAINAAGSQSSVMVRIKNEIADALNLIVADNESDLLLRIRPTPGQKNNWDVLIRLTPRPIATRHWRDCNMPGALNASVAYALVQLTKPSPQDVFLNIACGSGTIMIEREHLMESQTIIGCDIDTEALNCAKSNIRASTSKSISLIHCDGMNLPFADNSIDALCADLPFGQLVGSHEENEWLYPAILVEASRVARSKARFVVITHEVRLMDETLKNLDSWNLVNKQMITLSGLHPRIYVLERK